MENSTSAEYKRFCHREDSVAGSSGSFNDYFEKALISSKAGEPGKLTLKVGTPTKDNTEIYLVTRIYSTNVVNKIGCISTAGESIITVTTNYLAKTYYAVVFKITHTGSSYNVQFQQILDETESESQSVSQPVSS
jgi:hypothetical protein